MAKDERSGFADPEDFRTVPGLLPVSASTPPSTSIGPFQQNQQESLQAQVQRGLTQDTSGARNFASAGYGNTVIVAASDAQPWEKATANYVCDGFEDENEINHALLEGSVRLTSGTFAISTAAIAVPSFRSLIGSGSATVLQAATGFSVNIIENSDQTGGNTSILLADFVIDGNDVDLSNGVELDMVTDSIVRDLQFKDGGTNCGVALEIDDATSRELRIIDNVFTNWAGAPAIQVTAGQNIVIIGNHTDGCFQGLDLESGSSECLIEGNSFADSTGSDGAAIDGSSHILLGNTVANSFGAGIVILATHCIVIGNFVYGNSQETDATHDGILLFTADTNNVQGNIVRHGGGAKQHRYGINVSDADSNDNLVTNNDLRTAGRTGALNDSGTGTLTGPGNNGVHTHASASTGGQIAAASVTIADAGGDFTATTVEGALDELQADAEADATALSAHLTDTSDAHDASAVSVDSTTLVGTGTDVQAVLEELDNGIADHLADSSDAHDASAISFSATGSIAATDVQAAIAEVASEYAAADTAHAGAADPHTGYRLESADHSHATTGLQGGTVSHDVLTGVSANDHHNQAHAIDGADHTGSLAAEDITIADAAGDFTATDVEGALAELQADNEAHVAAGDPHTGYRLESADHSHQSTGAQAGKIDHGAALNGLTDDDHTNYALLAGRSGGQELIGGTASGDDLALTATSHVDGGSVIVDAITLDLTPSDAVIRLSAIAADPAGDLEGSVMLRGDAFAIATLQNQTWLPHYMDARVWDDFIYGSVGKMPWEQVAIGTGTLAFSTAVADHPGILTFDGNDADAGYCIHRGLTSVVQAGVEFCAMLVRFDSTAAAQHLSAGLGDSTTTTDDTDAIGFVISAAATIRGRCRAAGSETQTSTGFTFSANTWYWLVFYASGSGYQFVVLTADGTLGGDLGVVTTNVPSGALGPNVRWRTTNATDKTMDLDAYVFAAHYAVTPLRKT